MYKNNNHRPPGSPQPRERESQKAQLESIPHGENKDVKRKIAYKTGGDEWKEKARFAPGKETRGGLPDQVQAALDNSTDLRRYGLKASGSGTKVAISGIVDTLSESEMAAELAAGLPGVQEVVNNITISTDGSITDAGVTMEVQEELEADPQVDLSHIGAEGFGGTVILTGNTDDPAEIEAARQAAARARGVTKVVSQVKRAGPSPVDMSLEEIFHSQVRNDQED
ncbi:MAG: periplasmic protein [Pelotomaculum sp. PtaB.Bin104]|nr:MAG: periplasmic protein [Pelotomaculum sp. PtaB.Bin104]